MEKAKRPKVWLLEFDMRFEVFKEEFVFYDFKAPMKLPRGFYLSLNCVQSGSDDG